MSTRRKQKHLDWRPPGHSSFTEHELPTHDPVLAPHDEAVFLLHVAAEVEHALLVQYLYAAYSLKDPAEVPAGNQAQVRSWKRTLLGIAREEMGHLITVQNLLRLLGAPITLEREDYPFRGDLYPFHFRLEPLSRDSLAKYVVAEMPYMQRPTDEIAQIIRRATSASTIPVNRVGAIYQRLLHLFSPYEDRGSHPHLSDDDFDESIGARQAHCADWGNGDSVLVPSVRDRDEALAAIEKLAEQGEGLEDAEDAPSHFQRFLAIYREFPEAGEWEPVHAVPVDPNTAPQADPALARGCITHPRSRLWAQLSNLRYRLLLAYLAHFLQTHGPLRDPGGDYTPRGYLRNWTFDEMRRLGRLAGLLARLPRSAGEPEAPERAGAPFELPYLLTLPERERDRWRLHLNVIAASTALAQRIREADEPGAPDPFLKDLLEADGAAEQIMRAAMAGEELPAGPDNFKKVVQILEDAVRGFYIGAHHNFWRDCTRDEFVSKSIFGVPLIARTEDGRFDAGSSNLIKALRGEAPFDGEREGDFSHYPRMPAEHPPVPREGIAYIHRWIEQGCPDSDPPGQIGIAGEHEPEHP
jgi:rubrerythrin